MTGLSLSVMTISAALSDMLALVALLKFSVAVCATSSTASSVIGISMVPLDKPAAMVSVPVVAV